MSIGYGSNAAFMMALDDVYGGMCFRTIDAYTLLWEILQFLFAI